MSELKEEVEDFLEEGLNPSPASILWTSVIGIIIITLLVSFTYFFVLYIIFSIIHTIFIISNVNEFDDGPWYYLPNWLNIFHLIVVGIILTTYLVNKHFEKDEDDG